MNFQGSNYKQNLEINASFWLPDPTPVH